MDCGADTIDTMRGHLRAMPLQMCNCSTPPHTHTHNTISTEGDQSWRINERYTILPILPFSKYHTSVYEARIKEKL